jgi:hypothetical protein
VFKGLLMSVSSHAVFTADPPEREVTLLVDLVRLSRLTLLYAEAGADKSAVLRSSVMPLLQRGAGTGHTELAVLFDKWNEAPLLALISHIEDTIRAAAPGARLENSPHDAGALSAALAGWQKTLGITFVIIFDRFEQYLSAAPDLPEIRKFEEEFVAAVNDRALRANFLLALEEEAAPLLGRLRQRIPGLGDARVRLPSATAQARRDTERQSPLTRPVLVGSEAPTTAPAGSAANAQNSSDEVSSSREAQRLVGSQSKRQQETRTESLEQRLERMRAEYNARIVLAPHAAARKHANAVSPTAPMGASVERDTPTQPLHESAAPEQAAAIARHESTPPEQPDATARHESAPPEQDAATARYESAPPEQDAATARYESAPPEEGAATARHESARPEQAAVAARHQTASEEPAEVERRVVEQPSLQPRLTRAAAIAHKPFPTSRRVWVMVSLALIVLSSILIMRQGRFPERAPEPTQSASPSVSTRPSSAASTDDIAAQSTLPALRSDDTPLRTEQEYFASEDWLGPGNGTAATRPATGGSAPAPAAATPPSRAQPDRQSRVAAARGAASSSADRTLQSASGPLLYIHVRSESQRARAERMIRPLARRGIRVTGIKVVKSGPPVPDLRYFRSAERDEAVKVALALRDVGLPAQRLNHMRGFEGRATPRQYELWLPAASRRSAR